MQFSVKPAIEKMSGNDLRFPPALLGANLQCIIRRVGARGPPRERLMPVGRVSSPGVRQRRLLGGAIGSQYPSERGLTIPGAQGIP